MNNIPLFRMAALSSGILLSLLGLSVLLGWFFHCFFLIQLSPSFAPMQFNSALCFLLAGLTLICQVKEYFKSSILLIFFLFMIPSIILIQYFMETNLGIDELFIRAYIIVEGQYPGRMAPNSAFALICGAAALCLLLTPYSNIKSTICLILSLIVFNLGALSIIGYVTNLTTHYGLGQWIKMGFHSAIGFIILSTGIIATLYLTARRHRTEEQEVYIPFIPLLTMAIILLATSLVWQAITKSQNDYLQSLVKIKTENLKNTLSVYMQERNTAFARITYRWINRNNTPEAEWHADVMHYISDQPGYRAIERVDASYKILWVAPEKENEQLKGFNLSQESNRWHEMKKALTTKHMQMSNLIDLMQGGRGVLLFSPIFKNSVFSGFMVGVINTQIMLEHLFHADMIQGYGVEIYDEGRRLYQSVSKDKQFYDEWSHVSSITLLGQTWQLVVWPEAGLYHEIKSPLLPLVTIIIGVFIASLTAFLLTLLQLVRAGATKLHQMQRHLAEANGRLNGIIEGSSDLIAAVDLNLNFIAFNTMYKTEVYRLFKIELQHGSNFSQLLERMSEENRSKVLTLWQKALQGTSFTVTEEFNDKRFDMLNYEIHYSPIYNEHKELIGASHIASNITLRMNSEKKMEQSKKELEYLVASLEQQNQELGCLKELINLLQSSVSLDATLQPIQTYIKRIFPNSAGVLYLADKQEDNLLNHMIDWGSPVCQATHIAKSDCWALLRSQIHHANLTDKTVLCHHVQICSAQPDAYLCLPLAARGTLLGLLYLEMPTDELTNKRIINLAQILSEQIALSIYNITLRDELKNQSTHDSLTGLYNRRFFEEYLKKEFLKALRVSVSFSLLLIDIDYFKKINDTYGHQCGDKVLQLVAEQLKLSCRQSDLVCRWGGEEFLLFFRDSAPDNIKNRAEALKQDIENLNLEINGIKLPPITISAGVAFYPYNGSNLEALIIKADEALYKAKNSGRNKVIMNDIEN